MVLEVPTIDDDSSDEAQPVDHEDEEEEGAFEFDMGDIEGQQPSAAAPPSSDDEDDIDEEEGVRLMKNGEELAGRTRRASKAQSAYEALDGEAIQQGVFDSVISEQADRDVSFYELGLSRPLLKAVDALGFTSPTPVQAKVLPLALAGRDVCASAATGSGKTAAFGLPAIERLLIKTTTQDSTAALVLQPTRELAVQCEEMLRALALFTKLRCALVVGGTSSSSQHAALRQRPEIIVATPGRLLDHATNSVGVDLGGCAVLVLDEADRLLELGFEEQIKEILRLAPGSRQSLLFSATFGTRVESLASLSLRKPVRVKVAAAAGGVAARLTQDFVRLRSDAERQACLVALLRRSLADRKCVVFFDTKSECIRTSRLLSLFFADQVWQLHGDLKQSERAANFAAFRDATVGILACTDVAARGLDVADLRCVVNYEMPRTVASYVHRVGRTARAGRSGLAVTLVGADRRLVLKEFLRARQAELDVRGTEDTVRARTVPAGVVAETRELILAKKAELDLIAEEEEARKAEDLATLESERAENLIKHADEIGARPKRTWFQTTAEKRKVKDEAKSIADEEKAKARVDDAREAKNRLGVSRGLKDLPTQGHRLSRKKRRRLEAMQGLEDVGGGKKFSKKTLTKDDTPLADRRSHKTTFDIGGSGGGAMKASKNSRPSSTFTEFDASKVGKRVKKSQQEFSGSFKSKARYKRRG